MAEYALGAFLERWYPSTRHDLAASESETWKVSDLLEMATGDDRARWDDLALGYTDPRGTDWLRDRISAGYQSKGSEQIVCCAGAQEALGLVLRALIKPGDHAIMIVPAYQPSEVALTALCEASGIALDANNHWALDIDLVAQAIKPNTRLILVNFPNNPTGKVISATCLDALISLCRMHGLWLVNDEVYREIDRDPSKRLPPVADAYERGVSIDAMSKGYGLPGLRVGWLACEDKALLVRATELKQVASLCLAAPSEVLAHVALGLRNTLLGRNRAIAESNLAVLQGFLIEHEDLFDWHRPEGGVVGYVRYRGPDGVEAFTTRMAQEAGALVLPSSVWRSSLCILPTDRFRIGFGRKGSVAGIGDINQALRGSQSRSAA